MKKIKQIAKMLWKDESAQGATEYILLLMVVVAIVILFKDQVKTTVNEKLGELGSNIGGFSGE